MTTFKTMSQTNSNCTALVPDGEAEKDTKQISKWRIIKNVTVISFGTLFIIGADELATNFQSTLNSEHGVGVASVAVQAAFSAISSVFLPKYLVLKFSSKSVMVLSIVLCIPFFAANYYPVYYLMIVTSVLSGGGFTIIWAAMDPYINNLARLYVGEELANSTASSYEERKYSEKKHFEHLYSVSSSYSAISNGTASEYKNDSDCNLTEKFYQATGNRYNEGKGKKISVSKSTPGSTNQYKTTLESVTVRFFSFHSMVYQTCYIWSNLASFFVLQGGYSSDIQPSSFNDTCLCGVNYCNVDSTCSELNLQQPSAEARNILISVCVGLSLLGAIIVGLFLDDLKKKETIVSFSEDMFCATFYQMKRKNTVLLVPMVLNIGLLKGFYVGDFTKSYVGCAWGVKYVGVVTACAGLCMAFFSTVSGWFTKHIGRLPIFLTMFILNTVFNVCLIIWQPDRRSPVMFFVSAGLWGGLYGTQYTQVRALYGVLFKKNEEAAFGSFQVWYSVSGCVSLAYNQYLCNNIKVYIMIAVSVLGIVGYLAVERRQTAKKHSSYSMPPPNKKANTVEITRL